MGVDMLDPKGHRIVVIEYDGHRKPALVTSRSADGCEHEWSITDTKHARYYQHRGQSPASAVHVLCALIGAGRRHPIWGADEVHFARARPRGRQVPVRTPAQFAAIGMRRVAKPLDGNPFDGACDGSYHDFAWCSVCGCDVDVDAADCRHVFPSATGGETGPGVGTDTMPETLALIVRRTGCARALRRALRAGTFAKVKVYIPVIGADHADVRLAGRDFSDAFNALHGAREDLSTLREGLGWFRSLGADTPDTNAVVLRWLDAEIAAQDARRAAGEALYRVHVGEPWSRRGAAGPRVPWAEALAAARAARAAGHRATLSVRVARAKAAA